MRGFRRMMSPFAFPRGAGGTVKGASGRQAGRSVFRVRVQTQVTKRLQLPCGSGLCAWYLVWDPHIDVGAS